MIRKTTHECAAPAHLFLVVSINPKDDLFINQLFENQSIIYSSTLLFSK